MRSGCVRVLSIGLLAALVVLLGGCFGGGHALGTPDAPTIPVGQSTQTIEWAGASRTFNLYRPQGLTGAVPLVVMLHGGFGDGAQAERAYHWDTEADNGHFLVAYYMGVYHGQAAIQQGKMGLRWARSKAAGGTTLWCGPHS